MHFSISRSAIVLALCACTFGYKLDNYVEVHEINANTLSPLVPKPPEDRSCGALLPNGTECSFDTSLREGRILPWPFQLPEVLLLSPPWWRTSWFLLSLYFDIRHGHQFLQSFWVRAMLTKYHHVISIFLSCDCILLILKWIDRVSVTSLLRLYAN